MSCHRNTFGPRPERPASSPGAIHTASLARSSTTRHAAPARRTVGGRIFALGAALAAAAGLFGAAPASAQLGNDYAKIIMHIVPASGSMNCNSSKGRIGCANMKTAGNLNQPYYAFVCVVDGDANKGIAGLEFGVDYNSARSRGVDIFEWNLCGTLEFPMDRWPTAGTGTLVTWDALNKCQREEPAGTGTGCVAVAGYFYMTAYTPDKFEITRRSIGTPPTAKVADCAGVESLVDGFGTNFSQSHLGFLSFSDGATVAGYNPCGLAKPVEETTWGGIKSGSTPGR